MLHWNGLNTSHDVLFILGLGDLPAFIITLLGYSQLVLKVPLSLEFARDLQLSPVEVTIIRVRVPPVIFLRDRFVLCLLLDTRRTPLLAVHFGGSEPLFTRRA